MRYGNLYEGARRRIGAVIREMVDTEDATCQTSYTARPQVRRAPTAVAGMSGLASRVAAAVDESKDAEEQADGGEKQDQDSVAEGGTALGARGRSVLVAHGAALGGGARGCESQK